MISAALNMCVTLGYHRRTVHTGKQTDVKADTMAAQEALFWTVYVYEGGIATRLDRPSGIRDSDITVPAPAQEPRYLTLSRIQRRAWEQLYSPAAQSTRTPGDRESSAWALVGSVRTVLADCQGEMQGLLPRAGAEAMDLGPDPMRIVYLQSDLVCYQSILSMLLRVIPGAEEECAAEASRTLEVHEQAMRSLRQCSWSALVSKYMGW
jgi:hypothetical protein